MARPVLRVINGSVTTDKARADEAQIEWSTTLVELSRSTAVIGTEIRRMNRTISRASHELRSLASDDGPRSAA